MSLTLEFDFIAEKLTVDDLAAINRILEKTKAVTEQRLFTRPKHKRMIDGRPLINTQGVLLHTPNCDTIVVDSVDDYDSRWWILAGISEIATKYRSAFAGNRFRIRGLAGDRLLVEWLIGDFPCFTIRCTENPSSVAEAHSICNKMIGLCVQHLNCDHRLVRLANNEVFGLVLIVKRDDIDTDFVLDVYRLCQESVQLYQCPQTLVVHKGMMVFGAITDEKPMFTINPEAV